MPRMGHLLRQLLIMLMVWAGVRVVEPGSDGCRRRLVRRRSSMRYRTLSGVRREVDGVAGRSLIDARLLARRQLARILRLWTPRLAGPVTLTSSIHTCVRQSSAPLLAFTGQPAVFNRRTSCCACCATLSARFVGMCVRGAWWVPSNGPLRRCALLLAGYLQLWASSRALR